MNRRIFLKLLGLSPIAPVLLRAKDSGFWMTREDYEHLSEPYDKCPATEENTTIYSRQEWHGYYECYDFKTKERIIIDANNKIRSKVTFDTHPYLLFGKNQELVDSGEITYLIRQCRIH